MHMRNFFVFYPQTTCVNHKAICSQHHKLLVSVVTPCANWTLMGLATFIATHSSCVIALGFTNECVVPKSKRHNTPLVFTLNLNNIKFGPNLAKFTFAMNPPCAPILFYFFTVLGKVPQLFVVETLDFGNVPQLFFH